MQKENHQPAIKRAARSPSPLHHVDAEEETGREEIRGRERSTIRNDVRDLDAGFRRHGLDPHRADSRQLEGIDASRDPHPQDVGSSADERTSLPRHADRFDADQPIETQSDEPISVNEKFEAAEDRFSVRKNHEQQEQNRKGKSSS